jgi:hypothetical protein
MGCHIFCKHTYYLFVSEYQAVGLQQLLDGIYSQVLFQIFTMLIM